MFPILSFRPYMVTIAWALLVTFSKSESAPVEILLYTTCSAARPSSVAHISSNSCSVVVSCLSSGRYQAAPSERPLGTMVTFSSGLACSVSQDIVACPASWMATLLFSEGFIAKLFFSKPPMILSTASRKSCLVTLS